MSSVSGIQRSVRFSDTAELVILAEQASNNDDELGLKWYSQQEQDRLKRTMLNDMHEVWQKLATARMSLINPLELVGMDALLSPEVIVFRTEHKVIHVSTIIAAQERQTRMNIRDDVELAWLSARSSTDDAERAWLSARSSTHGCYLVLRRVGS